MRLSGIGLGCVRGGQQIFAGLNFSVDAGEALVVTGPNGAGKTSLLRVIAGLLRPAAGRFELEGGTAEASLAEQAHYLGHQDALKPALSVAENLLFWVAYLGAGGAALEPALNAAGLDRVADLPASYLSAGQRRRLSLARLIAVQRPLWLLDEPTASLDDAAQAKLGELMRAHRAAGGIIVAATHAPLDLDLPQTLRLGATS